ncbi:MAG: hypothetical protein AAGC74_14275 [Verrucomicrobiota bacterium]
MNVLALTLLISLVLAGIFIACFTIELLKPRKSSLEQTALLPLDDDSNNNQQSAIDNRPSK